MNKGYELTGYFSDCLLDALEREIYPRARSLAAEQLRRESVSEEYIQRNTYSRMQDLKESLMLRAVNELTDILAEQVVARMEEEGVFKAEQECD